MIDVEEVELEEWGRHPGVLVLSSSHQMLPGELRGTGWGWGEPGAGHCCPEADGTTWLKTQILASGRTAGCKLTDGHFLGGADR